ncbi:hypothetical protein FLJC2902T_31880 [Flavobacterium limnosediminis JC2902]|uniref:Uncharacterized protein n=1 Tax=Flavobacterium limnosediminis JC2902 TaxID=1341181 RepID=V6SDM5_9FLAO|nr:hypothetical protein [Flavobacterium limnosediminis]ESU24656.1 hypothetical protein FLJC2902T_31880 [Flavobacterium limnosediminis JC2902]
MKQLIFLFFITLILSKGYSQDKVKKDTLTFKENKEWIDSLKLLKDKEIMLAEIKKKIWHDRNYNVHIKSCFIIPFNTEYSKSKEKLLYEGKIAFVLNLSNKYYKLDAVEFSNTFPILRLLNQDDIDKIRINPDPFQSAVRWSEVCGEVEIISTSKELERKLKNVL